MALLLATVGCKAWQPATVSPARAVTEERPSSVRIVDTSGDQITIQRPTVRNDSIVEADNTPTGLVPRPTVGVPADEVVRMEVARFSPARSVILAGGIVAVAAVWARAAGGSEGGSTDIPPGPDKGVVISLTGLAGWVLGIAR